MTPRNLFPINVIIPLEPVPKQRPRFNGTSVYTPAKTVRAEGDIMRLIRPLMKGFPPTDDPIYMEVYFYCKRPKKPAKKYPRSDTDNFCKLLMDSLNGIVYEDDAQIVELHAKKAYADNPRTELKLDILV